MQPSHLVSKVVFFVYRVFMKITLQRLCLSSSLEHQRKLGQKVVLTEFPWLTKESWSELVLTDFIRLPKDLCKFAVLTKLLLVNIGNRFRTSVYRGGSANEGFCCFGI